MLEIGSEFHQQSFSFGKNDFTNLLAADKRYVLSGRTALSVICYDLRDKKIGANICLPAYCCYSMIRPFLDANFDVGFYSYSKVSIQQALSKYDNFLVLDYFGFYNPNTLRLMLYLKSFHKNIIVDATQTAFCKLPTYEYADYLFASHRKWIDSLSASVYCSKGFSIPKCSGNPSNYIDLWRNAAFIKSRYLMGDQVKKEEFLSKYRRANRLLADNYVDMFATDIEIELFENVDSYLLREARRNNASVLLKYIEKFKLGTFLNCSHLGVSDLDCPLFVPCFISGDLKDNLQSFLASNGVFCPSHWPYEGESIGQPLTLQNNELSLICDQRYNNKDMFNIVQSILDFITGVLHG